MIVEKDVKCEFTFDKAEEIVEGYIEQQKIIKERKHQQERVGITIQHFAATTIKSVSI